MALDANGGGQVVGHGSTFNFRKLTSSTAPFLWENGEMKNLNQLILDDGGFKKLDSAQGINEAGEIVGYGIINDERHAFLALPLP